MGKHTPGVKVREEMATGGYVLESLEVGEGHYSVVGCATQRDPHPRYGGGISAETALANATLWAAAPAMLEALKEVAAAWEHVGWPKSIEATVEQVHSALAKAGG